VLGLAAPHDDGEERRLLLPPAADGDPEHGPGDPGLGGADLGVVGCWWWRLLATRLPSSSQSCSNCRMRAPFCCLGGRLPCAAANNLPFVGRTSTWTRACFRSAGRCAGPARDLRSVFQRRQHLDARRCCRSSAYRRDVAAVGGRASQGGPGVAGSCPGQQHAGPLQPHDAQADEQRRRGHGPVVG
jgi:hypothetical protein